MIVASVIELNTTDDLKSLYLAEAILSIYKPCNHHLRMIVITMTLQERHGIANHR